MNLSVLSYILPSQSDDLIINNIESYGKEFWDSVQAKLAFKTAPSENLATSLRKYNIEYIVEPYGFWLTTMSKLVTESKTKYFLVFFEDTIVLDKDKFIQSIETLILNDADFMPTLGYAHWNKIVDQFNKIGYHIEFDNEFSLMQWGTFESALCEAPGLRDELGMGGSVPYPISLAGIFKKEFFLDTSAKMMQSKYWQNVRSNPDHYAHGDWAMNPKLPHSYEVYWVHNKRVESVEYTALIPKIQTTKGNDPKDLVRGLYQD